MWKRILGTHLGSARKDELPVAPKRLLTLNRTKSDAHELRSHAGERQLSLTFDMDIPTLNTVDEPTYVIKGHVFAYVAKALSAYGFRVMDNKGMGHKLVTRNPEAITHFLAILKEEHIPVQHAKQPLSPWPKGEHASLPANPIQTVSQLEERADAAVRASQPQLARKGIHFELPSAGQGATR